MQTEPALVPDGMMEELEQECAERARKRQQRQAQRAAKKKKLAEAAARQAVTDQSDPEPPHDGGGGGVACAVPDESEQPLAPVIALHPNKGVPRRNRCLDGLRAEISIQPVAEHERLCPVCADECRVIGYDDAAMLDIVQPQLRYLQLRHEKRACRRHPQAGGGCGTHRRQTVASAPTECDPFALRHRLQGRRPSAVGAP